MPAQSGESLHGLVEKFHVGTATEVLDEVEAHGTDTAVMHPLEILVRVGLIDDRGATISALRARDAIERGAHVGAMAARVNDDRSLNAEDRVELLQGLERRI